MEIFVFVGNTISDEEIINDKEAREALSCTVQYPDGCANRITIQWRIAVLFSYFPKIRSHRCNNTEKFFSDVGSGWFVCHIIQNM